MASPEEPTQEDILEDLGGVAEHSASLKTSETSHLAHSPLALYAPRPAQPPGQKGEQMNPITNII